MPSNNQSFVSPYSWIIAPGDRVQSDYTTPTLVTKWVEPQQVAEPASAADKQLKYGQWVAQVLQCQLGIPLVELYTQEGSDRAAWPLTLREDVIAELDKYFAARKT